MTLVLALRALWHRRVLMAPVLLLACVVGLAITYHIGLPLKPRQYRVGVGSAAAFIDSSQSQVASLGQTGSDIGTLAARASLLASLMASSPIKDDIARRAGIAVKNLAATSPDTLSAAISPAPAVTTAALSASQARAAVLTISVPTLPAGRLPIIQVSTQAGSAAAAAGLADAAFAALAADVSSVAAADQVPALQRLVIRQLGPATSGVAIRGPGLLSGIIGGLAALLLGCAVIVWVSSLAAAWRHSLALEREPQRQPQAAPDSLPDPTPSARASAEPRAPGRRRADLRRGGTR